AKSQEPRAKNASPFTLHPLPFTLHPSPRTDNQPFLIRIIQYISLLYSKPLTSRPKLSVPMTTNLSIAIQAALHAGKEILKVYETHFNVEIRGDDSPLTQADKNANEVINTYLKPTNIPVISEENRQLDFSERKNWSQCWIVDPLDGTKEFIKK